MTSCSLTSEVPKCHLSMFHWPTKPLRLGKFQGSHFQHRGKNWRKLVVYKIFQKAIGNNVYVCHKYIVISLVNTSLTHRLFQAVVLDLDYIETFWILFFWRLLDRNSRPHVCQALYHLSHSTSLVWFRC
jgi:hypothetical protein